MPKTDKPNKKLDFLEIGITGMEGLLPDGVPRGTLNLLSGKCGTGKTTFAMRYIYYGAKEKNENGVYITFEDDPEELVNNMELRGWGIRDLITKKKISIIKPELSKFDTLKKLIEDEVDKIGAKRLVIDSFTLLTTYLTNTYDVRKSLSDLKALMRFDMEFRKMHGQIPLDKPCTTSPIIQHLNQKDLDMGNLTQLIEKLVNRVSDGNLLIVSIPIEHRTDFFLSDIIRSTIINNFAGSLEMEAMVTSKVEENGSKAVVQAVSYRKPFRSGLLL